MQRHSLETNLPRQIHYVVIDTGRGGNRWELIWRDDVTWIKEAWINEVISCERCGILLANDHYMDHNEECEDMARQEREWEEDERMFFKTFVAPYFYDNAQGLLGLNYVTWIVDDGW